MFFKSKSSNENLIENKSGPIDDCFLTKYKIDKESIENLYKWGNENIRKENVKKIIKKSFSDNAYKHNNFSYEKSAIKSEMEDGDYQKIIEPLIFKSNDIDVACQNMKVNIAQNFEFGNQNFEVLNPWFLKQSALLNLLKNLKGTKLNFNIDLDDCKNLYSFHRSSEQDPYQIANPQLKSKKTCQDVSSILFEYNSKMKEVFKNAKKIKEEIQKASGEYNIKPVDYGIVEELCLEKSSFSLIDLIAPDIQKILKAINQQVPFGSNQGSFYEIFDPVNNYWQRIRYDVLGDLRANYWNSASFLNLNWKKDLLEGMKKCFNKNENE